jgi:hypothetical protein
MKVGELNSAIRRAQNLFDNWNQCAGIPALRPGTGYYDEVQSLIEDAVHCGAQAATGDFRRLDGEEGPIAGAPSDTTSGEQK